MAELSPVAFAAFSSSAALSEAPRKAASAAPAPLRASSAETSRRPALRTAKTATRAARPTIASAVGTPVTSLPWPYVTVAGGMLILLAGLLALRFGKRWPAMSGRYERDGTPRPRKAAVVDPDRPEDLWKALDRGEDPTR